MVLVKMQKLSREISTSPLNTWTHLHRCRKEDIHPKPAQEISNQPFSPKQPNVLLMIQLLLRCQPIRCKNQQPHGIPRAKASSDVVHRLEELEFGDHLGVGALTGGGLR